jgi:hypothetical protein
MELFLFFLGCIIIYLLLVALVRLNEISIRLKKNEERRERQLYHQTNVRRDRAVHAQEKERVTTTGGDYKR